MEEFELNSLLRRMTTREKLGQLLQLTPAYFGHAGESELTGPPNVAPLRPEDWGCVGSVLNCVGARQARLIQQEHLRRSRHGIPLLFMADIIHGFKTIFPIPLAAACSFSPELNRTAAQIAAQESTVSGIHVTFSPMADLVRDPRWGRVMESSGEDPLLNSRFTAAAVQGYQLDGRMAACVKHFAAYGAPEGGREYGNVELSSQTMEEAYLPGYRAALDAGARMVMAAFNTIEHIPATANKKLLRELLRKQWDFDGVLISDYNAVDELINHGIAANRQDAAALALDAGVDIEMMSTHYLDYGEALLRTGRLQEDTLNDAVLRVLRLKAELGLFENPYAFMDEDGERKLHLCNEHRQKAREIAKNCPVLLKNEGNALPFSSREQIGLTGPFAASRKVLGGWSAGNTEGISLWEGLCSQGAQPVLAGEGELGSLLDGVSDIEPIDPEALRRAFADCSKVIVAVGENQKDTGEGASKTCLRLSARQEELIHILKSQGKTVIAVVFSGRPLELEPIISDCDALLQAWFLGTESGNALAELLLGKTSPSGKLCMSFPRRVGQIPIHYAQLQTGRPERDGLAGRYASRYIDCPNTPLFPFGYGLTYSSCHVSGLCVAVSNGCHVKATVTNSGTRACTETLQLYIGQPVADIARPVKLLRDFCRIELQPGESKTATFYVTRQMLCYPRGGKDIFQSGAFRFMVGLNSEHTLCEEAEITQSCFGMLEKEHL